ncbi:hypothetical protein EJP02_399 [Escherichia phage EJP2]|nr:hypothetical protein EJP02_399 [Escherichia phage EJP2]
MFSIMYKDENNQPQYLESSRFYSWTDDLDDAAKFAQEKTAEKEVKKMYKNGFDEQLYVVSVKCVAMSLNTVKMPPMKNGYTFWLSVTEEFYRGPKKNFGFSSFSTAVSACTIFKTEEEAEKTMQEYIQFLQDCYNMYKTTSPSYKVYKDTYDKESVQLRVVKIVDGKMHNA